MDLKYRKKIVSLWMIGKSVVLNLNGEVGPNLMVNVAPRIIAIRQRASVYFRTCAGYEAV